MFHANEVGQSDLDMDMDMEAAFETKNMVIVDTILSLGTAMIRPKAP